MKWTTCPLCPLLFSSVFAVSHREEILTEAEGLIITVTYHASRSGLLTQIGVVVAP